MTTKTQDYNSSKNQDIKGKFVGREVFCNVNTLMEENKGWENGEIMDEIENYYGDPECINCGETFPDYNDDDFCPDCGTGDENQIETAPQEVLEWWAVTNWLAEKLKEQGEPIYDSGSVMVWGRCTSGQAILLDLVISRICEDMEILEGQSNEWSV